jgi:hypothetical protein
MRLKCDGIRLQLAIGLTGDWLMDTIQTLFVPQISGAWVCLMSTLASARRTAEYTTVCRHIRSFRHIKFFVLAEQTNTMGNHQICMRQRLVRLARVSEPGSRVVPST